MANQVFGIINTQNTCFMNSVLQVLLNIPELRNQVKEKDNDHPLFQAFKKIVLYWERNTESRQVLLKSLCQAVYEHLHFRRGEQQDAHEFFYKFIDHLHELTKQDVVLTAKQNNRNTALVECEQAWNKFCRNNYSAIISTFYAQCKNTITCPCSHQSLNREQHCGIMVDVAEHLSDSIEQYFKGQVIDGYKCESCHTRQRVSQQRRIEVLPEVLVIQVNRFLDNNFKNNKVLPFTHELDLGLYVEPDLGTHHIQYKLVGMVCHYGSLLNSGHYNVVFKHNDGHWYIADDEHVRQIKQVSMQQMGSTAYMFFYRRVQ